jgi:hypothetical protein
MIYRTPTVDGATGVRRRAPTSAARDDLRRVLIGDQRDRDAEAGGPDGQSERGLPVVRPGEARPALTQRVRPYVHRSVYALDPWLRSPISSVPIASGEVHGRSGRMAARREAPRSTGELEAGTRFPDFETWDRICKLYGWPQTFVT